MQRRGFLGAILAAGMAPAFVGAKVLMPVRALVLPAPAMWGDGSDDAFGSVLLLVSGMMERSAVLLADGMDRSLMTHQYAAPIGKTINLRRPQRYVA